MRRTWNRPARVQMAPVLAPTEPWEGTSVVTWGTAHYDPATGLFKLWYEAWNAERPQPLVSLVCYATSTDGVTWDKPDLGLFEWEGSRANNICWMMRESAPWDYLDSPQVLVDPQAPESERYRMVIYARVAAIRRHAFFVLTRFRRDPLDVA